jgi:hypothetical protein
MTLLGSTIGSNASNRQDKPLIQRLKKLSQQRFCHSLLEGCRSIPRLETRPRTVSQFVGKPEQAQRADEGRDQDEHGRGSAADEDGDAPSRPMAASVPAHMQDSERRIMPNTWLRISAGTSGHSVQEKGPPYLFRTELPPLCSARPWAAAQTSQ